jgi:hypothetical protein
MPEAKIKEALIQLHVGIKDSDGPAISAALIRIEELHAAHSHALHPQLEHFLSGRSYAKALAYLGGSVELSAKPSSPPGGCTGGRS